MNNSNNLPPNFSIISGNILDCEGYIVHQCNCQTIGSRGLATQIFNRFPYANIYNNNNINRIPGNICITHNVIGLFSQNKPGKPDINETKNTRLKWFVECLNKILLIDYSQMTYKSNIFNFPYMIGCGLAEGDWDTYYSILVQFATTYPQYQVRIVKLP